MAQEQQTLLQILQSTEPLRSICQEKSVSRITLLPSGVWFLERDGEVQQQDEALDASIRADLVRLLAHESQVRSELFSATLLSGRQGPTILLERLAEPASRILTIKAQNELRRVSPEKRNGLILNMAHQPTLDVFLWLAQNTQAFPTTCISDPSPQEKHITETLTHIYPPQSHSAQLALHRWLKSTPLVLWHDLRSLQDLLLTLGTVGATGRWWSLDAHDPKEALAHFASWKQECPSFSLDFILAIDRDERGYRRICNLLALDEQGTWQEKMNVDQRLIQSVMEHFPTASKHLATPITHASEIQLKTTIQEPLLNNLELGEPTIERDIVLKPLQESSPIQEIKADTAPQHNVNEIIARAANLEDSEPEEFLIEVEISDAMEIPSLEDEESLPEAFSEGIEEPSTPLEAQIQHVTNTSTLLQPNDSTTIDEQLEAPLDKDTAEEIKTPNIPAEHISESEPEIELDLDLELDLELDEEPTGYTEHVLQTPSEPQDILLPLEEPDDFVLDLEDPLAPLPNASHINDNPFADEPSEPEEDLRQTDLHEKTRDSIHVPLDLDILATGEEDDDDEPTQGIDIRSLLDEDNDLDTASTLGAEEIEQVPEDLRDTVGQDDSMVTEDSESSHDDEPDLLNDAVTSNVSHNELEEVLAQFENLEDDFETPSKPTPPTPPTPPKPTSAVIPPSAPEPTMITAPPRMDTSLLPQAPSEPAPLAWSDEEVTRQRSGVPKPPSGPQENPAKPAEPVGLGRESSSSTSVKLSALSLKLKALRERRKKPSDESKT